MSTEEQLQEMDRREMTEKTELSRIIENSNIDEGDKKRVIARIHTEEFRGPIPHPQILRQYDEIQPGLAEKIVGMALREQEHRHEMDSALVKSEVSLDSGKLEIIRASIKMKSRLQLFGFYLRQCLCVSAQSVSFLTRMQRVSGRLYLQSDLFAGPCSTVKRAKEKRIRRKMRKRRDSL